MASTTPADDTLAHLTRLSQKPGVTGTLVLSRSTGAIVRTSGLMRRETSTDQDSIEDSLTSSSFTTGTSTFVPNSINDAAASGPGTGVNGIQQRPISNRRPNTRDSDRPTSGSGRRGALPTAEEVARAVWKFFAAAGGMVEEFGTGVGDEEVEDEVKLVRLRMRRREVVVVPDAKFLLVVIHDTPLA